MLETREIPRSDWMRFFDDFSRPRRGWIVALEVYGASVGDQWEAGDLPLVEIIAGPQGTPGAIEIVSGGRPTRVTHTIRTPRRVWLIDHEDTARRRVRVESEDGTATVVLFQCVQAGRAERLLPETCMED